MNIWLITTLILLLVTANGAPVIAGALLGKRWDWPLDGHRRFFDQRPLLGVSKTLRGFVIAIIVTTIVAPLLGLTWFEGAYFGLLAMLGDLCSSFIKRRLGLPSSKSAPLLDQLPESIFPVWVMQPILGPNAMEMFVAICAFLAIDLLFSQLLSSGPAR